MNLPEGFHAWRFALGNPYAGIEWLEESSSFPSLPDTSFDFPANACRPFSLKHSNALPTIPDSPQDAAK
jgi:hypothetical protein